MAEPNNLVRGEHSSASGEEDRKWKVSVKHYSKTPIDEFWAVAGDFCGLERWVPGGAAVTILEGSGKRNEPGCIRRCVRTTNGEERSVDEKLLVVKDQEHLIQYTLVDENWIGKLFGFTGYVATMKVEPAEGKEGCIVYWSSEMTPTGDKPEDGAIQLFRQLYNTGLTNLDACTSASAS